MALPKQGEPSVKKRGALNLARNLTNQISIQRFQEDIFSLYLLLELLALFQLWILRIKMPPTAVKEAIEEYIAPSGCTVTPKLDSEKSAIFECPTGDGV